VIHILRSLGTGTAVLVALLGLVQPAQAQLVSAVTYSSVQDGDFFESTATSQQLSFASARSPDLISAFVQTNYGVQRAQVRSAWFGSGRDLQAGGGNINSQWTDSFIISGGVGTGVATYQVLIDGNLEFSPLSFQPSASIILRVRGLVPAATNYVKTIGLAGDSETWQGTSFTNGVLTRDFEFTYGSPFQIQNDLVLGGGQGGLALFGSTVVAGMVLPDGASLTTGSGALYAPIVAVPVPPGYALMLSGLAVIGLALRRKVA
jgi:hypothetical protein